MDEAAADTLREELELLVDSFERQYPGRVSVNVWDTLAWGLYKRWLRRSHQLNREASTTQDKLLENETYLERAFMFVRRFSAGRADYSPLNAIGAELRRQHSERIVDSYYNERLSSS